MATSSFARNYVVKPEKAAEFVDEMSRDITSTLNKGFKSKMIYLSEDKQLKERLRRVLNNGEGNDEQFN